jgi:hypothetical protein
MLETEETLDKRIHHFENMSIWHHYLDAPPIPIDITSLTQEEVVLAQKKAEARKLMRFKGDILQYADKFETEALGTFDQLDSRATPIVSPLEDHKACIGKMTLSDLKDELKNQRVEIERIGPVCENFTHNYLRPEVQAAVDKGEEFLITLLNPAGRIERYYIAKVDFPDFEAHVREKIEILQEAKKVRQEVAAVYADELKYRESQSLKVVEAAVKEAHTIVKEAAKMSKIITRAVQKCKGPDMSDLRAAEAFILAKDRFRELENQYTGIRTKIEIVCAFADVANKLPLLLAVPICENEQRLRDFAKLERYSLECAKERWKWNR